MEASFRVSAVALHAQDLRAVLFGLPETGRTYVALKIAIARRNAPARALQLQISNRENRLPCIFSTAFGFQHEKPSTPGDMPLTCEAKRFAHLRDTSGTPQQEDPFCRKRGHLLSCRAEVGREVPCTPRDATSRWAGAHGVTRSTGQRRGSHSGFSTT